MLGTAIKASELVVLDKQVDDVVRKRLSYGYDDLVLLLFYIHSEGHYSFRMRVAEN